MMTAPRRRVTTMLTAAAVRRALICAAALLALSGSPQTGWGFTPESPEVQRMVDRGVEYLEDLEGAGRVRYSGVGEGAEILIGYAIHKAGRPAEHPKVASAIEIALKVIASNQPGRDEDHYAVYTLSVSAMLLADIDPEQYRPQLEAVRDYLVASQKPHGGWGYPRDPVGDTSQVQYAVLALWTLDVAGVEVPLATMEAVCGWLLRTQDRTGGFGYHPRDPGPGGARLSQTEVRQSLTVAGMGTLLIAGDFFRFYRSASVTSDDSDLPPALRRIRTVTATQKTDLEPQQLQSAVTAGVNWQRANPYRRTPSDWHYYTLYADERFQSFLELAEGRQPKEPAWYNAGVRELMQNQDASGAWGQQDPSRGDPPLCTAFAILYLVRSTKKAIGNINEGLLAGGYGLPKDTSNVRIDGAQVKGQPVAGAVDELLDLLDSEEGSQLDEQALPENLQLHSDPEARARQLSRLERMARGGSWQGRRVATRLLGQSGAMEVVPVLIYALSDPDAKVRRYARDGLRFVSRRFDGFGMPDDPTAEEIRQAQRAWRQWYQDLNPGFVFIDS